MFYMYRIPSSAFILLLNELSTSIISAHLVDNDASIVTDRPVMNLPYEIVSGIIVDPIPGSMKSKFKKELDYKSTGKFITNISTSNVQLDAGMDGTLLLFNQINVFTAQRYTGGETIQTPIPNTEESNAFFVLKVDPLRYFYLMNYIADHGYNIYSTLLTEKYGCFVLSSIDDNLLNNGIIEKVECIEYASLEELASKVFNDAIDLRFITFFSFAENFNGQKRVFISQS